MRNNKTRYLKQKAKKEEEKKEKMHFKLEVQSSTLTQKEKK